MRAKPLANNAYFTEAEKSVTIPELTQLVGVAYITHCIGCILHWGACSTSQLEK